MVRRISLSVTLVTLLLVLFAQPAQPQERTDSGLLNKTLTLELNNSEVGSVLRVLSGRANISIGFEEIPKNTKEQVPGININVEKGTVRDILDELIRLDPRYRWEIDDGVINVLPRNPLDTVLDVKVHTLCLKDVDAEDVGISIVELPEVKSRLDALGMVASKEAEYDGPVRKLPVFSITFSETTVHEILNEILRKGYSKYWVVRRYGDQNQYLTIRL